MKKICLTVVGLYLLFLHAFSQATAVKDSAAPAAKDSPVAYIQKPLHLDEINLVSSYYTQDGNHSAVTGGVGNEHVTDLSSGVDLKFITKDNDGYKYTLTAGLGLDHHTAASSAYVNKSGASKTGGTRVYPSLSYSEENKSGTIKGIGLYYSAEYNYHSFAVDANYSRKVGNGGELSTKVSAYFDRVKLIYPSELIPTTTVQTGSGPITITTASGRTSLVGGSYGGSSSSNSIPTSPRYTYTGSFSYAQIINKELQISFLLDLVAQNGYLSLPFHRVYFADLTDHVESLPDLRFKLPIGFRLNYFMGDNIILRSYYRYYTDDWGIQAHTASLEVPIKITPFFSVSPFYRFYTQTASTYFAPINVHTAKDKYYTSNYAYSAFSSNYFGVGIRSAPPGGIWKSALSSLEIRYGHYSQTTDLNSNIISFNFQFKQ
jgi:hypothetical protein